MVILYNPVSSAGKKPVLPFSLLAPAALLEQDGIPYRIIDGNLLADSPLDTLDRALAETGASILGVTVMPGPQLMEAVPLCREIRRRHPLLTIVWGGYFPSQHYQVCLESGLVDFVIRGHGEHTFLDLVRRIRAGEDGAGTPGVAYRDKQTGTILAGCVPSLPDPDFPGGFPYHRLDMRRYVRTTFMGRTLSHHSSYGCPFFCNFCAVVNVSDGRWRAQTAQRTAEITHSLVKNWDLDAIEFFDNNFFVNEQRVAEFSERISDLNIRWWGEGRIDTLLSFSDHTWNVMAQSGLAMVFLGAESGSDQTLRQMNKGGKASRDKTLTIAEKMRSYGIIPEFSFVVGNPPDPEKDIAETLDFIREVKKANPRSEIILYLYTPVPLAGSLYEEARKSGFSFPRTLEEWISPDWREFSFRRSGTLPWINAEQLTRLRNFERVLNACYPTSTDVRLKGLRRTLLRAAGAWRYRLRFYHFPLELRFLQRWFAYQRPETSGF